MRIISSVKKGLAGTVLVVTTIIGTANVAHAGTNEFDSVIDLAEQKGEFLIFLKAVEAAGLEEKLKSTDNITVFLPTDAAFEALPENTLDELLGPDGKDELENILSYHVVPESLTADKFAGKMKEIETLQGGMLNLNSAGRASKVNEASIIDVDLNAKNGVVHVIDMVLMPDDHGQS